MDKPPNGLGTTRIILALARALDYSQQRLATLISELSSSGSGKSGLLPDTSLLNHAGRTLFELTGWMVSDPVALSRAQLRLCHDYFELWKAAARCCLGERVAAFEPEHSDRRFRDAAWHESLFFDFVKQSYLMIANWLLASRPDGLDEPTARRFDFYTRHFIDAIAPTNFLLTNPEVLRATLDSGGDNLIRGLDNLLADLERGRITMTDEQAFQVGKNLAVTNGEVIFQNELVQLIRYIPVTEQVWREPLLVIPPWINKYYVLDLRPCNSWVRYAIEHGHMVFMISWVNPTEQLADKSFSDYMLAVLAAVEVIEQVTGQSRVNVVGYCIGGTLLAASAAYLAAQGIERFSSTTYLATMLDFSQAGELGVFIDDQTLSDLEHNMNQRGYLEGHQMATVFNMLRANDLIWSFVVNNYLLGKEPFPFDLLYWNSDPTRLPAGLHSWCLRCLYQHNLLVVPQGLSLNGVAIDLRRINVPSYFLSTKEDHIAPWRSTYAATQILSGPIRFVLAASGHVAGVINPPAAEKYSYWVNSDLPEDPDNWLAETKQHTGSWWPDWESWLCQCNSGQNALGRDDSSARTAIEAAPGSYVLERSE